MKKFTIYAIVLLLLASCVGRRQIEKQLHSGNYDQAISNAIKRLKHNKDKKRKQDFIIMLQDAFYKVVKDNHNTISYLKKNGNPEQYQHIFDLYLALEKRQRAIKAVMPLHINGHLVALNFNNYSNAIAEYRAKVSNYKYNTAVALMQSNSKIDNRNAFKTLKYIEHINPNFKEVRQLMGVAHHQGTNYVIVAIENHTNQIIPSRLHNNLLNFDTYGLNNFWTVYHANTNHEIIYDYAMALQLNRIIVSPEQITERQILRKKNVIEGWEYVLDANGNVAKDSLGNDIKKDKIITAKARFNEYNQYKSTQVFASVVYSNIKQNHLLESFPLESEFVFDNLYASVRGDKRALTAEDLEILKNRKLHFPSNEQMVFDTGEDLKLKLKDIISRYNFRS